MKIWLAAILSLLSINSFAGVSAEFTTGGYSYAEPGLMSLSGSKAGLGIHYDAQMGSGLRALFSVRGAGGDTEYASNGTGTSSGNGDYYVESAALLAIELKEGSAIYAGLGFRRLENDIRGFSSTGHSGYRRQSSYRYIPIGVRTTYRIAGMKSEMTVEYDRFISGMQISRLSDIDPSLSDLRNSQSEGFGAKARLMFTLDDIKIGPYIHYWNISRSSIAPIIQSGNTVAYGVEPANRTIEFGAVFSREF